MPWKHRMGLFLSPCACVCVWWVCACVSFPWKQVYVPESKGLGSSTHRLLLGQDGCPNGLVSSQMSSKLTPYQPDSWFWLGSWSHSSWDQALYHALHWQRGACLGFSLSPPASLSALPPLMLACCLSLSLSKQVNKLEKKVYHVLPIRWANIQKFDNTFCLQGRGGTGTFLTECKQAIIYENCRFIYPLPQQFCFWDFTEQR